MASGNFATCLAFTLAREGGLIDDPHDPGGRTNQGITQRTLDAWRRDHGEVAEDVSVLDAAERTALYRRAYWDAVGGDRLADGIDLALFDFAVNSGPKPARAAYETRRDGDAAAIVKAVCAARLSFLRALSTFARFGRGWTARVAACEALGVKMAEHARIGVATDAPPVPQVATRLAADSRVARAASRRHAAVATGVAVGGMAAQPALALTTQVRWPAAVIGLVVVLAVAALIGWKAYRARHRAEAYAALAAVP